MLVLYCVNDGKYEMGIPRIMGCIICYSNHVNAHNPSAKEKKGVITYYKTYGIIILTKHVNANHEIIFKKLEKEVNNLVKRIVNKQIMKYRFNVSNDATFFSFNSLKSSTHGV